ncbi:hypothetical protein SCHPADRAFT_681901 [Schizopora paradoxa]|uniref:Uncharacterized protein n=1 Tax=Schizopora paradoxa TaxID=27342 RepID=A0A0H2R4H7_9AGAM|nr:hypothetical protein SCHPADRAFT_681901 [Schizopora paradoxa]
MRKKARCSGTSLALFLSTTSIDLLLTTSVLFVTSRAHSNLPYLLLVHHQSVPNVQH